MIEVALAVMRDSFIVGMTGNLFEEDISNSKENWSEKGPTGARNPWSLICGPNT